MRRFFLLAVIALSALASSFAQTPQTGLYQFGPYDSPGADTINRGNLNVHLSIPVFSKPGRAGTNFSFALNYDSTVWTPSSTSGSGTWQPAANWGWTTVSNAEFGYVTYNLTSSSCTLPPHGIEGLLYTYSGFVYHDQHGQSHPFSYLYQSACLGGFSPTGTGSYTTTDNSFYTIYRNGTSFVVFTKTGEQYSVSAIAKFNGHPLTIQPGAGVYTDTNGNQITAAYNSSTATTSYTDTTGATVLTATGSGTAASPTVYTYTDTTGTARTVTVKYTNYNVTTKFGLSGVTEYSGTSIPLVSSIVYADGSQYSFTYENTPGSATTYTGRLASVTLPSGGTISYAYTGGSNGIESDGSTSGLTRTTTNDGTVSTVSYARSGVSATASTTTYTDATTPTANTTVSTYLEDSQGYIYETSRSVYSGVASGTPLQKVTTCYAQTAGCPSNSVAAPIEYVTTTLAQNGTKVGTDTQQYSGGFLVGNNDGYVNETTAYQSFTGADNIGFARVSSVTDTMDSTQIAETGYAYDQTALSSFSGTPQPVAESSARGNLTTVSPWLNTTKATFGATTIVYDTTGTAQSSTNPTGASAYSYDSTHSFLQGLTPPTPSSGISLPSEATYDTVNTGLPLTATDPNGQPVTYKAYDELLRPTEIDFPDGGKTKASYTPAQSTGFGSPYSLVENYQSASQYGQTYTLYDGYGRTSRIAVATNQSASDYYQSDICYDANGRPSFASYTYQGTGFSQAKICSGAGDIYAYDALGRVTKITHSDGTSISYAYNGLATQVTDENGVSRITQIDGHGRVLTVCEISSLSLQGIAPVSCGTDITGQTGFLTTYAYTTDTSNNQVTTVTQGAQTRVFKTDSLGRTVYVSEPERGVTTYSYAYSATAGLGLTVTRTRPQANQTSASVLTTTTTQYDALGRVVSVTYNDNLTPAKTFAYDVSQQWGSGAFAQNNLKGRLSLAAAGPAKFFAGTVYNYDAMGRVINLAECMPSSCFSTYKQLNYTYDWTGNMLSSTDGNPSGLKTSYTYTPANEYSSVISNAGGGANPGNIVTDIVNGPHGPIDWSLGNGLSVNRRFDALGRPDGLWVCTGGSVQPGCTGAAQVYGSDWTLSGSRITQQSDSGLGQTVAFGYDDFNRLASRTVSPQTPQNFTYTYDRYGNRLNQTVTAGSGPQPGYLFNSANNQITVAGDTGVKYDAAGNMTFDQSDTYTFDAEGRVLKIYEGSLLETLTYDSLDHLVRRDIASPAQSTETYYNPLGQRVASWDAVAGTQIQGNYYWGGTPVAYYYEDGKTHFEHQDGLGTQRMVTGYSGAVEATYTSLPFGDGQDFTGLTQDALHFAGLDYDTPSNTHDAQYRKYSQPQGRWLSPDPYYGSYDFTNPQSLNRYSYVLNNPLSYVDPLGLILCDYGSSDQGGEDIEDDMEGAQDCTDGGGLVVQDQQSVSVTASGTDDGSIETGYTSVLVTIPSNAPNNQILPCFVKGAATGAVGALVVGGAAAGAVALGIVSAPVVTAALGVAAVAGGAYAIYNGIQQGRAGNWAGVAFGVGSFAGGAVVGGAGGRALAETINGVASPAWSIGSDWAQGYRSNFPGGSVGSWWNSGTNPGSAGGSAASAGAGAATVVKKGC